MAFSLPSDLATNWADNVGMIENAAYLNAVAAMNNSLKAALVSTVNGAHASDCCNKLNLLHQIPILI